MKRIIIISLMLSSVTLTFAQEDQTYSQWGAVRHEICERRQLPHGSNKRTGNRGGG